MTIDPRAERITMKAVGIREYLPISDEASLLDLDIPKPLARGRDLLVAVEAIAVNPVDTKVRAPKNKVEDPPRILGWDAAGVVESVGADVTLFSPGDEVFYAGSITRPGSNSEFHLVDERIVGRKPSTKSFPEAAALPLTSLTAWEALFDRFDVSTEGKDAGKKLRRRRRVHRDPAGEAGRWPRGHRDGVTGRIDEVVHGPRCPPGGESPGEHSGPTASPRDRFG